MIDYMICFILIACIITEVYFILVKNKRLKLKGKDDFMTFALVIFFALIMFPLSDMDSMVENIRNILFLMAIFGTTAIKRGFSENGMEKICYTIPWDRIEEVRIDPYQTARMQVVCKTAKGRHKLLFNKYKLKEMLVIVEKHVSNIYIQSSLEEVLKMKKI